MRPGITAFALAASLLVASLAAAEDAPATTDAATSTASQPAPAAADDAGMDAPVHLGEKTYKQRINTVARKPLNHDLPMIDGADRSSWNGHATWQGVRDERPLIARKTMGFHDPRPHRTRHERVMMLSRGPIRGAGFDE